VVSQERSVETYMDWNINMRRQAGLSQTKWVIRRSEPVRTLRLRVGRGNVYDGFGGAAKRNHYSGCWAVCLSIDL